MKGRAIQKLLRSITGAPWTSSLIRWWHNNAVTVWIGFLLSSFAFFTSSCGYRWQDETSLYARGKTVSVPFVKGDQTGDLTASIIRELATTGPWRYTPDGADLLLCVDLCRYHDENIGFRYDRGRRDNLKHSIVPTETRVYATVKVSLLDTQTGCILCGPMEVTAWYDFDHDYYSSRNMINIFSLGQLTDIESAREAALTPLYRLLARNIAEYLRSCG